VAEYVLPLFTASLSVPQQLPFSFGKVPVTISAQYTFGEPVNGVANLKIDRWNEPIFERNVTITSETTTIDIDLRKDLKIASEQWNFFTINLLLRDPLTNTEASDSKSFSIIPYTYSIEFLSSSLPLVPGQQYNYEFVVKKYDGTPAPSGIRVTVAIQPLNINQTLTTNSNGIVSSSVAVPVGTSFLSLTATAKDANTGFGYAQPPFQNPNGGAFLNAEVITKK
jgi:hypothetical protein